MYAYLTESELGIYGTIENLELFWCGLLLYTVKPV